MHDNKLMEPTIYIVTEVTPAYFIDPEIGQAHEVSFADPGCELHFDGSIEDKTGVFMPFSAELRGVKFARVWIKADKVIPKG